MKTVAINSFADFMSVTPANKVEIINPMNGEVVRTLSWVEGQSAIHIRCGDGTEVVVEANTPVAYQPWVFDRGSLLFDLNGHTLKICTEYDHLREAGKTECFLIEPSNEARLLAENETASKNPTTSAL